jgi:hypothetical protein
MFSEHLQDHLWKRSLNHSNEDAAHDEQDDEHDFEELKLRIRREVEERAHRLIKREKR